MQTAERVRRLGRAVAHQGAGCTAAWPLQVQSRVTQVALNMKQDEKRVTCQGAGCTANKPLQAVEASVLTKALISGKVTSLYMPQRASQRKFGKSLKLHLAKQKKQKLEEHETDVCRREK